jgi:hypothetical protein
MSHKQENPSLFDNAARPVHAEDNRLAKRLFQLEQRVCELESRLDEMSEMIHVLFGIGNLEQANEISVCFCSCEEDEEDEDFGDKDEF